VSIRTLGADQIRAWKGLRFPVVTAYDEPFARFAAEAGIDVLLVGDSLGMVVLGRTTTVGVDLDDIVRATAAVVAGAPAAHVIADLPFGSYEASDADAIRAAVTLVRAGAGSVKLEGGVRSAGRVRAIGAAGIPVVGHIGVLPQTAALASGFGRIADAERLAADAAALVAAGAFAIVLEMVDAAVARELTAAIAVPTIGIGSGAGCDAQVHVLHDLLGLTAHPPPFATRTADVASVARDGLRAFADAVRAGTFPPERR